MVADKLDESWRIGLPVLRKAFEIFKDGVNSQICEQTDCIFRVLVEVGVKDALIHEVGFTFDRKEHPSQVVELEDSQTIG